MTSANTTTTRSTPQIGTKKKMAYTGLVPESTKSEATVRNQIPIPMAPARKRILCVDVSPLPSSGCITSPSINKMIRIASWRLTVGGKVTKILEIRLSSHNLKISVPNKTFVAIRTIKRQGFNIFSTMGTLNYDHSKTNHCFGISFEQFLLITRPGRGHPLLKPSLAWHPPHPRCTHG